MLSSDSNRIQTYLEQHRLFRYVVYGIIFFGAIGLLGYHIVNHALNTEKLAALPCPQIGPTNEIGIDDAVFQPRNLVIARCDQLVFVNRGHVSHWPAFGEHPKHTIYPSFRERTLRPGESNAATMSVPGTYAFHDHLDESITGQVIVTE